MPDNEPLSHGQTDAVHLAAALDLQRHIAGTGDFVILLTADEELLRAAKKIKLG